MWVIISWSYFLSKFENDQEWMTQIPDYFFVSDMANKKIIRNLGHSFLVFLKTQFHLIKKIFTVSLNLISISLYKYLSTLLKSLIRPLYCLPLHESYQVLKDACMKRFQSCQLTCNYCYLFLVNVQEYR